MSNTDEPAVLVKDLYKSFRLPHEQTSGLKQALLNIFRRTQNRIKGYETQHVLDNISFEIKKGEFFGIVGRNGSGKSTLLKLLAGIYVPDRGLVRVNGSLTPFIELGVGFNPELTGRENIYLNCALLGFSRKEVNLMYKDIVDFSELEKFMDQKLKNYSSGMQVRLAFSIAIQAKSDTLLLDEVLAVGDQAFQKKCYEYFRQLKKDKRTVILVTHDMEAVKKYCTRAMLIDRSRMICIGTPANIADEYSVRMVEGVQYSDAGMSTSPVKNIKLGSRGKSTGINRSGTMELRLSYEMQDERKYFIAYSLKREGVSVSESSSQFTKSLKLSQGAQIVGLTFDTSRLTEGEYQVDIAFYDAHTSELIAYLNSAYTQLIANDTAHYAGLVEIPSKWEKLG